VNAHYHSHDAMAKGLFEEMPFDIWTLHSNPSNYGPRSLEEVRLRTLLGAAESLRNGITTIQDFLTVVPQDEAVVDTVLSAYAEAGIRVVFAIAVRDRAALDIAPFMPADLPQAIRKRVVGSDRSAKDELDFIAAQIKRLGPHPTPRQTWALAPSAPQRCSQDLLEGIAALSRRHNLPVLTHVYETRIQAAAARHRSFDASLLDGLASAGLLTEKLGIVHGVWLVEREIARIAEAARVLFTIPSAISSSRAASLPSSISIAPELISPLAATTTVAPKPRTSSSRCDCCACCRPSLRPSPARSPRLMH
jgi:5-methylthioadenosine/S-adenosylhomocysteine deaminase